MEQYQETYTVQRQDNMAQSTLVSSPPYFSTSHISVPWLYPRALLPNAATTATTIITAQMDPQFHRSWTNAASISIGPPRLPSPQQSTFTDYWHHINYQPGSHIQHARRHGSSTANAMTSGGVANGPMAPETSLSTASSHSYPVSLSMSTSIPHQSATRYLIPQLHLNTARLEHGVPTFLSPHPIDFFPSAETAMQNRNENNTWVNGPNPVESRAVVPARSDHATTGASFESGSSLALWHGVPRLGPPPHSFPRWNQPLTSSTGIRPVVPDTVSQPHAQPQPYSRPPAPSTMPPPEIQQRQSAHPPTSEIPHVGRPDAAGYAYQARALADTNPMSRATNGSVDRTPRPPVSVRRRSSVSAVVNGTNILKRKPLPKIYGCDGCGKKFDRPSTLKVHEAIHTGAKDHRCEYCTRAFTVQSNMKRHMRVCKHKPLSPPMTLCYIVSTTAPSPLTLSASFQGAMQHIDRSNNLALGSAGSSASIHPSIPSASNLSPPTIETASGNVQMIPFEHPQFLPHSQLHPPPLPTVKGYRAPMIIAAMFSVQQNVPASVAKFTLIHLECDIPLPPVAPHPEYIGLYPDANGNITKMITSPPRKQEAIIYIPRNPQARYSQSSFASSSGSIPSTLHSLDAISTTTTAVPDAQAYNEEEFRPSSPPLEYHVDVSMQTRDISPLPDIGYEERNSYYPRTRYCYHPAEYDAINLLPGPGIEELPEEVMAEYSGTA